MPKPSKLDKRNISKAYNQCVYCNKELLTGSVTRHIKKRHPDKPINYGTYHWSSAGRK